MRSAELRTLRVGDRVVVPFAIACGGCYFCTHGLFSACDNSNPNALMAERVYGRSAAGLFGYSHMHGGYSGGQAEYVRVPYADVGPFKENCNIHPGDVVAVWVRGRSGSLREKCVPVGSRARDRDRSRSRSAQARGGRQRGRDDQRRRRASLPISA